MTGGAMVDLEALKTRLRQTAEPLIQGRRAVLVELICRFESGRLVARFLVDRGTGISIGELAEINRAIGARIEEAGLMEGPYLLEVNSPGLDRLLRSEADFQSVVGRRVQVTEVADAASGRTREHSGKLIGVGEQIISLALDSGEVVRIGLNAVSRAAQEVTL
ncbi:MAG: hypothetical protein COV76_03185 [Candidatus Omnitrophica bacterium CG11_big_fil_rev_8_21_14_0_20_64_10]|nr:MAG: hypothetical protein COV76_03185 [Candidatus Omnitrophica bacterium CG11_big_fil_rev_8_21_14_0_20_64_10]